MTEQFQFHTIRDIRKCWLHTPDNSFWVVDYMANEKSIIPISVLWDDLSPADQERVFDAFRNLYFYEAGLSEIPPIEASRQASEFFSQYWEIIPAIEF